MILGISSYAYGWSTAVEGHAPAKKMDEIDLLDKAHHFGLHCLQLGDNLPVHKFSEEQKLTLKIR